MFYVQRVEEILIVFRADEEAKKGFEEVEAYLVGKSIAPPDRAQSREALRTIADELGPVIDNYPTWHPILMGNKDPRRPVATPGESSGYVGLDHTRYFRNGFVTCPYGDEQRIMDAVEALNETSRHSIAYLTAEKIEAQLYHPTATPILVRCHWERPLDTDGMIPLRIALPLILEREVQNWRWAKVAETWETMRPYLLGQPHGSRSSLFVSQETGQAIKKIWNDLIYTGMFGPIYV